MAYRVNVNAKAKKEEKAADINLEMPKMSRIPEWNDNVSHPFPMTERPETNLAVLPLDSVSDALENFALHPTKENKKNIQPIVFAPFNPPCLRGVSIPHGTSAIVSRFGAVLPELYKEGFHCMPHFYRVLYLVNEQHIPYHFHVAECMTRDNIPIKIHVDLMFQITDPMKFMYDIGPEKLEDLLRSTQAEAIRSLVRNTNVADAYDLRGMESQDMVNSLNDRLKDFGVKIEFVTIANVTLPPKLAVALQNETAFDSKMTEQKKRQEFALKLLNDANFTLRVKQDRENERLKVAKELEKARLSITQEIKIKESELEKLLSEIEASKNADVKKVLVEGKVEINNLIAQKEVSLAEIKAHTKGQTELIRANAAKECAEIKSLAIVSVAENDAKALLALGEAEEKASSKMKARRRYELSLEYIQLWNNLAGNPSVMISGDEIGTNQMIATQNQIQLMNLNK